MQFQTTTTTTKKTIHNLRTDIIKQLSKMSQVHYRPLNQDIFKDMEKWGVSMKDFSSRIQIIKMNVLSIILYSFQSLPVPFLPAQFLEWDKKPLSIHLEWNGEIQF